MGDGLFIDLRSLEFIAEIAGHHTCQLAEVAHIPDLLELVEIVRQGKAVFLQLFLQLFGLLFVIGLLCLFNEGQHIAHAQNPAGHAVGMEGLNHIQLFAGTYKFDGLAGGGLDGEGCAAAGVAVQFGEHHTVDAQRFVKGGGGVDGVLAGHGVHHQQDLVGMDGCLHPLQLVHEGFVHMEPAGGI